MYTPAASGQALLCGIVISGFFTSFAVLQSLTARSIGFCAGLLYAGSWLSGRLAWVAWSSTFHAASPIATAASTGSAAPARTRPPGARAQPIAIHATNAAAPDQSTR